MNDLDTRVRQAFDDVTVPDDVKRSALTYIACVAEAAEQQVASAAPAAIPAVPAPSSSPERAPRKRPRARFVSLRRAVAAVAACLVLAVVGFGGFAYAQPTTYVGIDVNPSIELGVNRFGIVVQAEAFNDDGRALLDAVSLTGRGYADALTLRAGRFVRGNQRHVRRRPSGGKHPPAERRLPQLVAVPRFLPRRGRGHARSRFVGRHGSRPLPRRARAHRARPQRHARGVPGSFHARIARSHRRAFPRRLFRRTRPWPRWGTRRQRQPGRHEQPLRRSYVWHSWRVPHIDSHSMPYHLGLFLLRQKRSGICKITHCVTPTLRVIYKTRV